MMSALMAPVWGLGTHLGQLWMGRIVALGHL
jgi:hypothetical protein